MRRRKTLREASVSHHTLGHVLTESQTKPSWRHQRLSIPWQAGAHLIGASILLLALPLQPGWLLLSLGVGVALVCAHRPAGSVDRLSALFLGLFILASLASALFGSSPSRSLGMMLTFVPAVLLFYVVASRFSATDLRTIVPYLSAAPVLLSIWVLCIAAKYPGSSSSEWMNLAGYPHFSVPNDLIFGAILSPYTFYLATQSRHRLQRLISGIGLLSILAVLIVYQSRGGLLLFAAAMFLMIPSRSMTRVVIGTVLVAALVLVVDAINDFRMINKVMSLATLSSRLALWQVAWDLFTESPWLGSGPGSYAVHYERLIWSANIPQWIAFDERHVPWPHNAYLEIIAERGFVGMIFFTAFIYLVARKLACVLRKFTSCDTTKLGEVTSTSLMMLAVGGLFELSLHRFWTILLIFLLLATAASLQRETFK